MALFILVASNTASFVITHEAGARRWEMLQIHVASLLADAARVCALDDGIAVAVDDDNSTVLSAPRHLSWSSV